MDKLIFTFSYMLVFLGSCGMMLFARQFSFATALWESRDIKQKFLWLEVSGYDVWVASWSAILLGTVGQLVATWLSQPPPDY